MPEALRNYLLLLGWSHPDGKTEKLSKEEMIALFSLDRVNKSPATFDMAKLEWLNWEYLAAGNLDRERRLRVFRPPFEDFLTSNDYLRPDEIEHARGLTDRLLQIYWDSKGRTTYQEIAKLVFGYDAQNVVSSEETRHVAEERAPREVLASFIPKVLAETDLSYERFREIAKSAQKETGKKGKDLFHPIRVAVTGAVSGPELEKLIPIFEEGAKLSLARPVKSTAQRLREFAEAASIGF